MEDAKKKIIKGFILSNVKLSNLLIIIQLNSHVDERFNTLYNYVMESKM